MSKKQQSKKPVFTFLISLFVLIFLVMIGVSNSYASFVSPLSQTVPTRTPDPDLLGDIYLPIIIRPEEPTPTATSTPLPTATNTQAPPTATSTPSLPPSSFNDCQSDSTSAPNYPVKIVTVDKSAKPETVTLQNVSNGTVDLSGWIMCSINGNQQHHGVGGSLAPNEQKVFPYTGGGNIWNNSSDDDGALYNGSGQLVSYWNN